MKLMCKPDQDPSVYIKEIFDALGEKLSDWDEQGYFSHEVEPVEHESRSGFIPFTNGGWFGRASFDYEYGKDHFNCLKGYSDRDYSDMQEAFKKHMQEKIDAEVWEEKGFENMTPEEFWDYNDPDNAAAAGQIKLFPKSLGSYTQSVRDRYRDQYEDEARGDSTQFYLDFRAVFYSKDNSRNESGEDEVYFFAGVNTDFGYGRDTISWMPYMGGKANQHVNEKSWDIPVKDLTRDKVQKIADEMFELFSKA